jgi:hypothetical protein
MEIKFEDFFVGGLLLLSIVPLFYMATLDYLIFLLLLDERLE